MKCKTKKRAHIYVTQVKINGIEKKRLFIN